LKDYDYVILWLDYFNKNLSRTKGRKIKKEQAIFDPTLSDLISAARESGFDPKSNQINDGARYPRRAFVKSSYIALPKNDSYKKNKLIITLAQRMLKNRTDRSRYWISASGFIPMVSMDELGTIIHVARSGRIIVKIDNDASKIKSPGVSLVDSSGLRIGRVQEIFGPVFSPYASILPSRNKLGGIVGKKVFVADEDSFRKMKFKRGHGHRPKHKHAHDKARKEFTA
jgi:signal recognition particle subunit SRP19